MERETKLTPKYLKVVAKKFDLATIFLLKINNQGVSSIGSIPECTNLLMLDLSRNKILMLNGIGDCVNLTHLNISHNRISSLDPLKNCKELNTIMAQGNKVKEVKSVENLDSNKLLSSLYLKDFSGESQNPICNNYDYQESVLEALPNLKLLDGQMRGMDQLVEPGESDFSTQKPEYNSTQPWYSPEIHQTPDVHKNWVSKEYEESLEDLLKS